MKQGYTYNCPHCGSRFTNEDVDKAKAGQAYYILTKHGMSIRAVGRLFDMHPESVKYYIKKFEKLAKAPLLAPLVYSEQSEWGETEMKIIEDLELPPK
jgi:transposase